jgi:transposase
MRKRSTYRAVQLKDVKVEKLKEAIAGQRLVAAVDEAKVVPVAALMTRQDEVLLSVKWRQPSETKEVVRLLGRLGASEVHVVMEATGTYGDALRSQVWAAQMKVYQAGTKKVHDLAEVHDGVPSHHDAKSAVIIGNLHFQGRTEEWEVKSERQRDATAAVRIMSLYEEQVQRGKGRLEALMARHWPELGDLLELGSPTQLKLMSKYGSAQEVARNATQAVAYMRKVSRGRLAKEKAEQIAESARQTTGMEPTAMECELIKMVSEETDRARRLADEAEAKVNELLADEPAVQRMSPVVGETSAAAMYAQYGDPQAYGKIRQYWKRLGINMKENSSGKRKGTPSITKRAVGIGRQYLYLSVMRDLKTCEVTRAWFESKQKRDGGKGKGGRAIVALMRKKAAALWHVARGEKYDVTKLFNVKLLGLERGDAGAPGDKASR